MLLLNTVASQIRYDALSALKPKQQKLNAYLVKTMGKTAQILIDLTAFRKVIKINRKTVLKMLTVANSN